MAFEVISWEFWTTSSSSLVTNTLTIPADATAVLALFRNEVDSWDTDPQLNALDPDGTEFGDLDAAGQVSAYVWLDPSVGSQDLTYESPIGAGVHLCTVYVKGFEAIRQMKAEGTVGASHTTQITSEDGDAIVALIINTVATETPPGYDDPPFTSLDTDTQSEWSYAVRLVELTDPATSTPTDITGTGSTEVAVAAVSFQVVATGDIPPAMNADNTNTCICNIALGLIGAQQIDDYDTDTARSAILCRKFLPFIRDSLTVMHRWNFAMTRTTLTLAHSVAPDWGYDFRYALPDGIMRLWEVNLAQEVDYRTEDWYLLTDAEEVEILYTRKVEDPIEFTQGYMFALEYYLAAALAMGLTRDKELRRMMQDEGDTILADALATEAQESRPRVIRTENYVTARISNNRIPFQDFTYTPVDL